MALSRIDEVEPHNFRLEIPLGDFDQFPERLGVEVDRDGELITVRNEQPNCHLLFRVDADRAVLHEVAIRADVQGRFFQQVLGALLIEYQGDFRGMVNWSTPKGDRSEVVVDRGESFYPLIAVLAAARRGQVLMSGPSAELTRAEKYQAEGRAAYDEYLRLKARTK